MRATVNKLHGREYMLSGREL